MSTQTDFKTLGRLGTASGTLSGGTLKRQLTLRGGRTVRRGKPYTGGGMASWQVLGGAVLAIVLVLFILGLTAQSQLEEPGASSASVPEMDPALEAALMSGDTQLAATGSRTLIPGGGATAGLVEVPSAFAAIDDLALSLPAAEPGGVIFSEADMVDALALAPVGVMTLNDNPAGYEATRELDGPDYMVSQPASGVRPATGQAQILLTIGTTVLAPLTGSVVAVDEYSAVDGGRDWRIVIEPATRPDLQVVIRRIENPQVSVGQRVGVGQTALGQVRPGAPSVSERNPQGLPSVLLSVRPAVQVDSVDPYAAAVAPSVVLD